MKLEQFERFPLAHLPTPLEALDRLGETLGGGVRLFVKRDDCTGLAFGGNKTRKLEYLVAEARAQGCDTLVTVGGVQSNHARQTAAAAVRAGMRCELVLPRLVPDRDPLYEETGNVLLDRLLGARVHVVDRMDDVEPKVAEIRERVRAGGGRAAFHPPGGSTPVGALGYVRAGLELAGQLRESGTTIDRIVVAVSTAGTLAGLVLGLREAGLDTAVEAVCVSHPAAHASRVTESLLRETAELLEVETPSLDRVRFDDTPLGPGYGLPTPEMRDALRVCAQREALLLDPVYTGKAMAGLIAWLRREEIRAGENVLFWHTGGTPALFAAPGNCDHHGDTEKRVKSQKAKSKNQE